MQMIHSFYRTSPALLTTTDNQA